MLLFCYVLKSSSLYSIDRDAIEDILILKYFGLPTKFKFIQFISTKLNICHLYKVF